MLGRRGQGTLGLAVDLVISLLIFAPQYVWMNNWISNNAGALFTFNTDYVNVFNRIIWPWHAIPIGFLFAVVVRSIFAREWKLSMRSMLVWELVLVSLFVFYIGYMAYDYFIVTSIPGLIPTSVTDWLIAQGIPNPVGLIVTLWQNVLPWGVTLAVIAYGILSQDATPDSQAVGY